MSFGLERPPWRGRGDADARTGDAVHVPAAADPLPTSAMAQPGPPNLNNEVSTEIWEPVGLTFKAVGSGVLRQSEGRAVWQG